MNLMVQFCDSCYNEGVYRIAIGAYMPKAKQYRVVCGDHASTVKLARIPVVPLALPETLIEDIRDGFALE